MVMMTMSVIIIIIISVVVAVVVAASNLIIIVNSSRRRHRRSCEYHHHHHHDYPPRSRHSQYRCCCCFHCCCCCCSCCYCSCWVACAFISHPKLTSSTSILSFIDINSSWALYEIECNNKLSMCSLAARSVYVSFYSCQCFRGYILFLLSCRSKNCIVTVWLEGNCHSNLVQLCFFNTAQTTLSLCDWKETVTVN